MRNLLLLLLLFISITAFSQKNQSTNDSIVKWKKSGKITLLINQSAFSNWQAGGDNNFAGNMNLNYDFNYHNGDWVWDNKILASYGMSYDKIDGTRKTDDRLELNTIVAKEIKNNWGTSFFTNFKTQFAKGYQYEEDFTEQYPNLSNEVFPTSGFFKPAYLSFGPGLLWKKNDNLYVKSSPITAKFTFLTSEIFTYNEETQSYDSSNVVKTFGVEPGESFFGEFGFNIRAYYKFDIMSNISIENILNLFSNYLNNPQNVDVDYTLNLVMKINDVFSTNLNFQTIYDNDAFSGFQIREIFGLGLNVNL